MHLSLLSITLINVLTPMSDISSIIIYNCSYRYVSLFNVFNDTFGKQNNNCGTCMFNVVCIIK
jgi:hypothetical protein